MNTIASDTEPTTTARAAFGIGRVRWSPRLGRHRSRCRPGRAVGGARPERSRQDHVVQRGGRRHPADLRHGLASRASTARLLPSRRRPSLGVARTYQRTRLFPGLTVEDNLYLAVVGRQGRHRSLRRTPIDEQWRIRARDAAEAVWLGDRLESVVGDLSHGQQRQLEVGMAMVTNPDLMMLDEPASGLSRGERERLVELLESLGGRRDVAAHRTRHGRGAAGCRSGRGDGRRPARSPPALPTRSARSKLVRDVYLGSGTH